MISSQCKWIRPAFMQFKWKFNGNQMRHAKKECAMPIKLHCNELRALCPTTNALCRTYCRNRCTFWGNVSNSRGQAWYIIFARCSSSFSSHRENPASSSAPPPPIGERELTTCPSIPIVPVLPPDTHRRFYNSPSMCKTLTDTPGIEANLPQRRPTKRPNTNIWIVIVSQFRFEITS